MAVVMSLAACKREPKLPGDDGPTTSKPDGGRRQTEHDEAPSGGGTGDSEGKEAGQGGAEDTSANDNDDPAVTANTDDDSDDTSADDTNADGTDLTAAPGTVKLVAVYDLPSQENTRGLSGTWYDFNSRSLFALQDDTARIVELSPSKDFRTFTIADTLELMDRPKPAWDGEGLVGTDEAFFVIAEETSALIERHDRNGRFVEPLFAPTHFKARARENNGLESLSLSPSGRFLFTANETALESDGELATKTHGTIVRLVRVEEQFRYEERAYLTEPLGGGGDGDMGVVDVAALGDDDLLVLERGYQAGYGNTVRLFRVDFSQGPEVGTVHALQGTKDLLPKRLVLDFSTLPSKGVTNPSPQPNPILDNYEAVSVGPKRDDGRTLLFVTSDDNASPTQVARIIVLAVEL